MAPRSAKVKKAADVKVAEIDASKKGKGKSKNAIETEEQGLPEIDIIEKEVPVAEKKKRGKKAETNGKEVTNGTAEEIAPPTKRGRKKVEEPVVDENVNGNNSADDESNKPEEKNGDYLSNGKIEEMEAPAAKGRKKPAKKEEKHREPRARKAKQETGDADEKEEVNQAVEEKPKGKGRARKAQPKPDPEDEKTESIEEKTEPHDVKPKSKKRTGKAKEKAPDSEKEDSNDETDDKAEQILEEIEKQPKKKEPSKVKKQTKKAQVKDEADKKVQVKDEAENGDEEVKEEPASKKRKINKKEEKGQGDAKDEKEAGEEIAESKTAKSKRGKKVAEAAVDSEEEPQDTGEAKRKRKPAEDKAPIEETKKKAPAKNKATTDYEKIDFTNNSKNVHGKNWNFKIASWNVDGIRAWMSKGGLDYVKYEKPDILCLQEVKCTQNKLPEEIANLPGYHAYWLCSEKDGYAGVGVYTTQLAINVQYGLQNEELDSEGRIITAEYEQFYLICTYVPNAGRKLVTLPKRMQWNEEFRKYVKELDEKKPVIICGDMNVAHNEIDLQNPKSNRKNAGFTEEERTGMTELLGDGFVDTFRHFYPDESGAYTFWTYMMNSRAKNVGWRLDYFIVSERLMPSICDNVIRNDVYGSDHCPISLFLHLTNADKPKE